MNIDFYLATIDSQAIRYAMLYVSGFVSDRLFGDFQVEARKASFFPPAHSSQIMWKLIKVKRTHQTDRGEMRMTAGMVVIQK